MSSRVRKGSTRAFVTTDFELELQKKIYFYVITFLRDIFTQKKIYFYVITSPSVGKSSSKRRITLVIYHAPIFSKRHEEVSRSVDKY